MLLLFLYNKCLQQGKVPNIWKQTKVVIIKKGKDKDSTNIKSYYNQYALSRDGLQRIRLFVPLTWSKTPKRNMSSSYFSIPQKHLFDKLWRLPLFRRLGDVEYAEALHKSFWNYCRDCYAGMTSPDARISKRHIVIEELLILLDEEQDTAPPSLT